jgi:RNA recognition motif-containing protein
MQLFVAKRFLMKLLVRNLSRLTTEDQLSKLFKLYGTVQYCVVVLDKITGESKGFGFVEMPKPGAAKAAIKNLNGKEVDGNKIRVKNAGIPLHDKSSTIRETEQESLVKPNTGPEV